MGGSATSAALREGPSPVHDMEVAPCEKGNPGATWQRHTIRLHALEAKKLGCMVLEMRQPTDIGESRRVCQTAGGRCEGNFLP